MSMKTFPVIDLIATGSNIRRLRMARGFLIHILRALIGRVQQYEGAGAGGISDDVLVVSMHDDGVPQSVTGCNQPGEALGHVLPGDGKGFAGGGKAEDLVFEERRGVLDIRFRDLLNQSFWRRRCFPGSCRASR